MTCKKTAGANQSGLPRWAEAIIFAVFAIAVIGVVAGLIYSLILKPYLYPPEIPEVTESLNKEEALLERARSLRLERIVVGAIGVPPAAETRLVFHSHATGETIQGTDLEGEEWEWRHGYERQFRVKVTPEGFAYDSHHLDARIRAGLEKGATLRVSRGTLTFLGDDKARFTPSAEEGGEEAVITITQTSKDRMLMQIAMEESNKPTGSFGVTPT